MTPTEKVVSDLCQNSFLPFWSFPNPIGKKGKELCDLLVICDPDIIIFSVKEILIKESGDTSLDSERWIKRAIDNSVDQIYGAERIINLNNDILLSDRKTRIRLPEKQRRNIYRVAVAFGRGDNLPLKFGDFGKGFVHVFDEKAIHIVLQELNTITDFIKYLKALENFLRLGVKLFTLANENILALYLQNGLSFPDSTQVFILEDLWQNFSQSDEYKEKEQINKVSFFWDQIIEVLHQDYQNNNMITSTSREEMELSLRQMNKEDRYSRTEICKAFLEVIGNDGGIKTPNARIVKLETEDSPAYVFLAKTTEDRDSRAKELQLRCIVARQYFQDTKIVIGISTEKDIKGNEFSFDICYLELPIWTDELEAIANSIKEELGLFQSPQSKKVSPINKTGL